MTRKKQPEVIEDSVLDEASGGLPAIQKVRDAANRSSSGNTYTGLTTVNEGTLNATPTTP